MPSADHVLSGRLIRLCLHLKDFLLQAEDVLFLLSLSVGEERRDRHLLAHIAKLHAFDEVAPEARH